MYKIKTGCSYTFKKLWVNNLLSVNHKAFGYQIDLSVISNLVLSIKKTKGYDTIHSLTSRLIIY